jgi:riboflavin kinase/FMN adenylyltransferase
LLASAERKIELLERSGVDLVAVLPFNEEFSHWSPERFVEDVLVGGLGVRTVFVGHDWRFGHRAKGNVTLLSEMGERLGFNVEGVQLREAAGDAVSSSRIRKTIAEGDMETVRALLGRPFDVDGLVGHGDHRGKGLGFPTANLEVDPALARPPRGVYAGLAHLGTERRVAAINVGVNPTFGGEEGSAPHRIEAYLLDHEGDLYGQTLRVEFWKRLRDELKFDSADDLIAQMKLDVEETRRLVTI